MISFDPKGLTALLNAQAETLKADGNATATVIRVEQGPLTVTTATGFSDLETNAPARAEQTFEIGSQTKMMTAVVILQLAQEGKIDLDAKASDYLPADVVAGVPNADTATVRELLNMTSGIPNFTDAVDADGIPVYGRLLLDHPDKLIGHAEALDIARTMEATNAPGAAFNYSNTNYVYLGNMIESLTGQDFFQVLQDRIFDSAGMAHAVPQLTTGDDRLSSYRANPFTGDQIDVTRALWDLRGEAGVVAPTADMITFLRALLIDKTLLSDQALAQMEQTLEIATVPGLSERFGLGLAGFFFDGGPTYLGFTGGTLATTSATYIDPTTGTVVSLGGTSDEFNANGGAVTILQGLDKGTLWQALHDDGGAVQVTSGSAAEMTLQAAGQHLCYTLDGATLTLERDLRTLTQQNLQFTDGSVLVVGDNSESRRNDAKGNLIDIARDFAAALTHDNHLMGLGGADTLRGGLGDDRIEGGRGNDVLRGSAGDDLLQGGQGNDRIIGGAGVDTMEGGAGRDVFVFLRASGLVDRIADFQAGQDRIDLRGVSDLGHWIGTDAFSGHAGEVRMAMQGQDLLVFEDVNGDGLADLTINLGQTVGIGAGEFLF